jgi:hypothetical protein
MRSFEIKIISCGVKIYDNVISAENENSAVIKMMKVDYVVLASGDKLEIDEV